MHQFDTYIIKKIGWSTAKVLITRRTPGELHNQTARHDSFKVEHLDSVLRSKQVLTPLTLEKVLKKAVPAEKVWTSDDYMNAGVGQTWLALAQQPGDGMWICCCGHENTLIHYHGQSPVKYLDCGRCGHVLCEHCHTSEILEEYTAEQAAAMDEGSPLEDKTEPHYCRVCGHCGLSHRAVVLEEHFAFPSVCTCKYSLENAPVYHLGKVDNWRCEPALITDMLKEQRVRAKSQSNVDRPGMRRHDAYGGSAESSEPAVRPEARRDSYSYTPPVFTITAEMPLGCDIVIHEDRVNHNS